MRPDDWCVNPTTFCSSEPDVTHGKDKIVILLYKARWLVFKPSTFCSSEPDVTHSIVKLKCSSFSVSDVAHNDDLQPLSSYTPPDWTNQSWWKIHHWTIHRQKVHHRTFHCQEVHHRPVHTRQTESPHHSPPAGQTCIAMWYFFVIAHTHTHAQTYIHTNMHTPTKIHSLGGWSSMSMLTFTTGQFTATQKPIHYRQSEPVLLCDILCITHRPVHTTHSHTHPNSYPGWQLSLENSMLMVTGWHQWWTVLFFSFFGRLVVWWWVVHTPEQTLKQSWIPLTVNCWRVEDKGARARVSNPGQEVATGLHHGDLQTQWAGGGSVIETEARGVEQCVECLVPAVQVVFVNFVCTYMNTHMWLIVII